MALLIHIDATISVTAKYVLKKGNTFYFQRRVPDELRHLYGGKRTILESLKTGDPLLAAKKAQAKAKQLDTYWTSIRTGGDLESGQSAGELREAATRLLQEHKLQAGDWEHRHADPQVDARVDVFLEELVEPYRSRDERARLDESAEEILPPVNLTALELLRGETVYRLSDALDLYLKLKVRGQKGRRDKAKRLAEATFEAFAASIGKGDTPIADIRRSDIRIYVEELKSRGNKSGTIRRRINTLKAAIGLAIREFEMDRANPFEKFLIEGLGEDSEDRPTFTTDELQTISNACKETNDDIRWLIALLEDTGARLDEIVGLRLIDLHVEKPVPYVDISPNRARNLKTKSSERKVPLIGVSLWAAKRVRAEAKEGQEWAFPRYIRDDGSRATHASNTIAKWLRNKLKIDKTAHSFRHTLRDRLRNVNAPKDIQGAVGGWSSRDIGANYGEGYALGVLYDWMKKIELPN